LHEKSYLRPLEDSIVEAQHNVLSEL